jgi:hypothetical protein
MNLRKRGVVFTARMVLQKFHLLKSSASAPKRPLMDDEALELRVGELVEVKSADEIRRTLDTSRRTRGLLFMDEMWKFCGQRFRVHKRVDRILIERAGTIRKMKHTVLLGEVQCDGLAHGGCDASCYHYWREVWLRRVEP